jgi:hypothetical protein
MQPTLDHASARRAENVTPWSLRAWPPLLWQAGQAGGLQFHHLGTRVTSDADARGGRAGQTLWAGSATDGEVGVAWDWVQLAPGVVAMADPMSVVTNLCLLSDDGKVLTAWQASRFLNEIVHALPWQYEVTRALSAPPQ